MRTLLILSISLLSLFASANDKVIIDCNESEGTLSQKLKVTAVDDLFKVSLTNPIINYQIVSELFPDADHSAVLTLVVTFKNCWEGTTKKSLISCMDPIEIEYFDITNKLLHQVAIDSSSNPGFADTSFVNKIDTSGVSKWLNFNLILRANDRRIEKDVRFFSNSDLCETK